MSRNCQAALNALTASARYRERYGERSAMVPSATDAARPIASSRRNAVTGIHAPLGGFDEISEQDR